MKVFNNIEEMRLYYNKTTDTYEFIDDDTDNRLDIGLTFDLSCNSNIIARDIKARNIKAYNLKARDIKAENIYTWDTQARDIKADDIDTWDLRAWDIRAKNIRAWDLRANNLLARDINARDIKAESINAKNIVFYAMCAACRKFECESIKGEREKAKYFCLDSEVKIKGAE